VPGRIEDYGLIGDMQTAALVDRTGSVDWLCLPRFDSAACFAALLGTEDNGRWLLAPAGADTCTRRAYRGDTLILETEWERPEGVVRVIDFMPPRGEAPDIVRIVEGISGSVPMRSELRLRFDYGSVVPWVRRTSGGIDAVAGPDSAYLRTPVEVVGRDLTTYAEFTVRAGERVPFVLTWHPSHQPHPRAVDAEQALGDTERIWTEWIGRLDYDGEWRDAVARSLVTLKALTYAPTGGIAAAATTSLPETIGGVRNWDYRFCWLRDATMTLQSLVYSGYLDEAKAWREWLLRAIAGNPQDLRIMYGLAGERRLPEQELDWLAGYEGSKPVRVGNQAARQFQLDVYGEVFDALHLDRFSGLSPEAEAWELQRVLMEFLEGHWNEPDQSLWEVRGDPHHYVHSKVMAWAGADRMVKGVRSFGLEGPVDRWQALRDEIHRDVCEKGYDAERGTFTQYYGSKALDSALLLIPQVGFLPGDDDRVRGTVDAVSRELREDGYVKRYQTDGSAEGDNLPGEEGVFIACSFWLADALHLVGRNDEARELFERLLGLRNDLGLLSEEYDPKARRQLGNTPQAYSHIAVVNTARALSRRGGGRVRRDQPPRHNRPRG
jgi:GH15 family glucan-1,4-alpha-glucosidase